MEVVITRRFFSFILAGVIAASTIFPSSAWGKDSFISGGEEYESPSDVAFSDDLSVSDVYAAPRRFRMLKVSAADQAAAESNTTGKLVVPATLPSSISSPNQIMSKYYLYQPAQSTPPLPKFESDYWRDVVSTISISPSIFAVYDKSYLCFVPYTTSFQYSPSVSDPDEMVRGLALFCDKDNAIYPSGYILSGGSGDGFGLTSWDFTVDYDVW